MINSNRTSESIYWVAIVVLILFVALIRIRLLDIPLERDEGEFAYMGQLMLQGVPPYSEAYNLKLPGIYAAYALIMFVFGQTVSGIHLGLLIVNALTIVAVYLLARRLFDPIAGIVTASSYAILSLSQTVLGLAGHATHFALLPALVGILLMLRGMETDSRSTFFLSGIFFGVSFLMKQPAIFFAVFAVSYFVALRIKARSFKRSRGCILALILGGTLPFVLTCILLFSAGVFERFWFWTFTYAANYATGTPFVVGINLLLEAIPRVIGSSILLWTLAGVGLTTMWWNENARKHSLFLIMFLAFSFLAVSSGLYFRAHYFILILPAVSLLIGVAVCSLRQVAKAKGLSILFELLPLALVAIAIGYTIFQQQSIFFGLSPADACRRIYGRNPFPESQCIADSIGVVTSVNDKIAVVGSEPQIYFYSHRRAATGYLYTYALMEEHPYESEMQKEMIDEIERARPAVMVYVNSHFSWLSSPNSDRHIFEWFDSYSRRYYDLAGVVDIRAPQPTEFRWGADAVGYKPQSVHVVYIFRRKQS